MNIALRFKTMALRKKSLGTAAIATAALGALVSCAHAPSPGAKDAASDVQKITSMSKARAKAFREGNAPAIAEHFTETAVLMAPGKPARFGREAVRQYYQDLFEAYRTDLDSFYEEVVVEGDLAFGRGFAKVTLRPRDGGPEIVSTAKYLNILQRQSDGSWKTTHDVWNSNE